PDSESIPLYEGSVFLIFSIKWIEKYARRPLIEKKTRKNERKKRVKKLIRLIFSTVSNKFWRENKNFYFCRGELAEWSNAAVLKTVNCHRFGGSNPSLSAETASIERLELFCVVRVRTLRRPDSILEGAGLRMGMAGLNQSLTLRRKSFNRKIGAFLRSEGSDLAPAGFDSGRFRVVYGACGAEPIPHSPQKKLQSKDWSFFA